MVADGNEITGIPRNINQNAEGGKASATVAGRRAQRAKAQEFRVAQVNYSVRHGVHVKPRHWQRWLADAGSTPGKGRAGPALV
jgi:hypothetical protein